MNYPSLIALNVRLKLKKRAFSPFRSSLMRLCAYARMRAHTRTRAREDPLLTLAEPTRARIDYEGLLTFQLLS